MDTQQHAIQAEEARQFRKYEALLNGLARKCYGRLMAAGVVIYYEDVFQNMSMSFVQAHRTYKPEMGYSFSAYFGRACFNNFNKWAKKLIREQTGMENSVDENGEFSTKQVGARLVRVADLMDGGHDTDGDYSVRRNHFEAMLFESDSALSPEEELMRKQENRQIIGRLSGQAKKVMAKLIDPSADMTFAQIGEQLGMSASQLTSAKKELMSAFKVR